MTRPRFADASHPQFPEWMLSGLDMLFDRLGDRMERACFELWAVSGYDDNTYIDTHGTLTIVRAEGVTIDEEELDEIPAVRKLERMASQLWHHVPLDTDDEGSVNGEFSFYAEPGLLRFEVNHEHDDPNYLVVLEIKHVDGAWQATEQVVVLDYEGTISDVLAGDKQAVFEQAISAETLQLPEHPRVIGIEVGQDEEMTFSLELGSFEKFEASNVGA